MKKIRIFAPVFHKNDLLMYNIRHTGIIRIVVIAIAAVAWHSLYAADGIPQNAGEHCTFEAGLRYSELVINSRINDFKANTTASGFGVFDHNGQMVETPQNSTSVLDYVPGLVAKAILEAADYYKDRSEVDVAPWYYAVHRYATTCDIASNGKQGKSFDDLNAVKLYFKLAEMASSQHFESTDATVTTALANQRFASALAGIAKANNNYVITEQTLAGAAGGWWHKSSYTNQMWCDGQYMGPALLAQIINEYDGYEPITDDDWGLIAKQFTISWQYLWNDEVKLLYHAFTADPAGSAASSWAGVSAETGNEVYHSAEYWGRAEAWYFLALVDVLEQMDKAGRAETQDYQTLRGYLQQLAAGIASKQDAATGCWYQLLNHDGTFVADSYSSSYRYTSSPVTNYLESSCTAIFIAAYLKGMRLGLLDTNYTELAKEAYRGFIQQFMVADGRGGVHLISCCKSAGLGGKNYRDGSAAYYLMGKDTKPTSTSGSDFYTEGKVLGGFILAATEYERLTETTSVNDTQVRQSAGGDIFSLDGIRIMDVPQQGFFIRDGKLMVRTQR